MVGLTFHHIEGGERESDVLLFVGAGDTPSFKFYHEQDCCESVDIEDIVGDLDDLAGVPLLEAREDSQDGGGGDLDEDGRIERGGGAVEVIALGEHAFQAAITAHRPLKMGS